MNMGTHLDKALVQANKLAGQVVAHTKDIATHAHGAIKEAATHTQGAVKEAASHAHDAFKNKEFWTASKQFSGHLYNQHPVHFKVAGGAAGGAAAVKLVSKGHVATTSFASQRTQDLHHQKSLGQSKGRGA